MGDSMKKLVIVRHGQSIWNLENKFTGWTDVDLSENGVKEADNAGYLLKEKGYCVHKARQREKRRHRDGHVDGEAPFSQRVKIHEGVWVEAAGFRYRHAAFSAEHDERKIRRRDN